MSIPRSRRSTGSGRDGGGPPQGTSHVRAGAQHAAPLHITGPYIGGPMRARALSTILALLLAACGGGQSRTSRTAAADSLTERQRDSILAQSKIPGARAVGKAMRVADSTSAGIRAADSISP